MNIKETYRKLGLNIQRLNDHIHSTKNSPFLPKVVGPQTLHFPTRNVTLKEAKLRRESLQQFQNLRHYRVVDSSTWNDFLKSLYPMRNNLARLSSNSETSRQVNHDQLYRSYCSLPRPGVAHMEYEDFEYFMKQMFAYRAFLKPNLLSGTNIYLYSDEFILKQYADGLASRQAHLDTLWQITNDLDSAKIPLSDYERRNMVYKTFFRDRQDIMTKIDSIIEHNEPREAAAIRDALKKWQSPDFDYETYQDVSLRFGNSTDAETLNVLLFTALRHRNTLAYADIMAKFRPESFTRDTFKILLENLALNGKPEDYSKHLSLLVCDHIAVVDIRLLNIIVSSLVNLNRPDLAISVAEALSVDSGTRHQKNEQFLKLLKTSDKTKYSLYIAAYDDLEIKPPVKYHPTEQTFLPILKHYCETGADFETILKLLGQVEARLMLPLTSQMFKHVFRGFILNKYDVADLQHMLAKLIETHDLNSGARDTWIREQIKDLELPSDLSKFLNELMTKLPTPGYTTEDNNFIKLSNGLVRQVFQAYYQTLGQSTQLKEKVLAIERDLEEAIEVARAEHKSRITRDELEAIDLHEREQFVYLKKTSLLKLMDIPSLS